MMFLHNQRLQMSDMHEAFIQQSSIVQVTEQISTLAL